MPDLGGDITIGAHIDGSGLPAELRRAAERAARGVEIEVPTDLDEKRLAAQVQAAAKTMSKFAEIEFQADLDSKRLAAEVAALKKSLGGTINIANAPTELRSAWAKANRQMQKLGKDTQVRIAAQVDFEQAQKDLAGFRAQRLFMKDPIKVPVELDPRGNLMAQMRRLRRELESMDAINLQVDIDEAALQRGRLGGIVKRNMQKQLDDIRAEHLTIRAQVEADLAPLEAQLRAVNQDRRLEAKIRADVDAGSFAKAQAEVRALVDEDITVKMHLQADPQLIKARVAEDAIRAAISERPIKIPVKVEVDNASVVKTAAALVLIRGLLGRLSGGIVKVGSGLGNLFGGFKGNALVGAAGAVLKFFAASVGLIAGAIAVVLPYVKALGALLAYVALQLLAAASAAATFAVAGLAAIGGAMVTAIIGTHGLGTALAALNKLWDAEARGVKATKKELKEYKETLKTLTPSARDFVTTLDEMHPALRKVQQAVQETLFKGLGDQLALTARSVLPTFSKGLQSIALTLNGLALSFLTWLGSDEAVTKLNTALGITDRTLGQIGRSIGNFALGFLNLFLGADDNINSLGGSLERLSKKFLKWSESDKGQAAWKSWLATGRRVLGDLGAILGDIGSIAIDFWKALTGENQDVTLPDVIDKIRKQFDDWAKWWKDPKNRETVKEKLIEFRDRLTELAQAAEDVAKAINAISDAIERLRDLLGSVENNEWLNKPGTWLHEWLKNWWETHRGGRIRKDLLGGGIITLNPVIGPTPTAPNLDPIPWPIVPQLGPLPRLPNLPPIPWPIVPRLGGVPQLPSLPPIPWPVIPRLGPLPNLPNLPPIPWPIIPRFGPLPPFPILVPGLWPIISRYLPLPPFPTLPNPLVRIRERYLPLPPFPPLPSPLVKIRSRYLPLPPFPALPSPVVKVRIQYVGGGPVPGSAEYCRQHPGSSVCMANGGIVHKPTAAIIGEAGPEAVVPLTRTQALDPGVRALLQSVAADRGMMQPTAKTKDKPPIANLNVLLPTGDPEAAAMAVWNRLVFEGVG